MQGFKLWRWAPTFLFVVLGWVMFRAESVGTAFDFYGAMFRFDGAGFSDVYASSITQLQLATMRVKYSPMVLRNDSKMKAVGPANMTMIISAMARTMLRFERRSEEHTSELQ